MLVRVEIVTPRNGKDFLKRIAAQDPKIDHLCLELVHWKFDTLLVWLYEVHAICSCIKGSMEPAISVHGFGDEITRKQIDLIMEVNAVWMPRNEEKNRGKDCATIIYEMVSCRVTPKIKRYPDDCVDLDHLSPTLLRALPDDEFEELLKQYAGA